MVKKLSLFVSNVLALALSLQLLPSVILILSMDHSYTQSEIWTVIVFLFSAPVLVAALIIAIASLRKRAYERFAIMFNFFGALTIAIYKFSQLVPLFQEFANYTESVPLMLTLLSEILVQMAIIIAIMLLATVPLFIKQTENY